VAIHPIRSKAAIKGHPLHPMIVGFPIAYYTGAVASLIAYASIGDVFWFRAAMTLAIAGVAMAVVAGVLGAIDLFFAVPRSEARTRRTGYRHFGLNMAHTVLFTAMAALLWIEWRGLSGQDVMPAYAFPLVLGLIGMAILAVAGAFGAKLVTEHHVGLKEAPLDERPTRIEIEPAPVEGRTRVVEPIGPERLPAH
jgi:uncharacterized membrane protein